MKACDDALALDPKNVRALMQKAIAMSTLGEDDQAEALVNQAVAIAPNDPTALKMRADFLTRHANSLAIEASHLRQPRVFSNTHTENRSDGVYNVTVTTYYPPTQQALNQADQLDAAARQLYSQADAAISAALKVTQGTFDGLLLQADVQYARGQTDQSEATLKKALAQKPDSLRANQALADLYLKTGRTDQACLQQSATVNLFQTTAGWTLKVAWGKIQDRQYPDAIDLLNAARKLDPQDARVPAYMGMILRARARAPRPMCNSAWRWPWRKAGSPWTSPPPTPGLSRPTTPPSSAWRCG